ncbi:transposase, partial [Mesorhizobium sp. M1423]|uniref:hypothetical protein n=1 Tax=Mesorhizobium sp. M1423 TaxID=2957101 RepID=UPI00333A6BFC
QIRLHLPTSCPDQRILRIVLNRIPRLATFDRAHIAQQADHAEMPSSDQELSGPAKQDQMSDAVIGGVILPVLIGIWRDRYGHTVLPCSPSSRDHATRRSTGAHSTGPPMLPFRGTT